MAIFKNEDDKQNYQKLLKEYNEVFKAYKKASMQLEEGIEKCNIEQIEEMIKNNFDFVHSQDEILKTFEEVDFKEKIEKINQYYKAYDEEYSKLERIFSDIDYLFWDYDSEECREEIIKQLATRNVLATRSSKYQFLIKKADQVLEFVAEKMKSRELFNEILKEWDEDVKKKMKEVSNEIEVSLE